MYPVQYLTAGALVLVAVFAVVARGGSAAWARSELQFASFAIAALVTGWLGSSARTPRITAAIVVCCGIPVWGAMQLMLGTSVYEFATRNAVLDGAMFAALFFIALQIFENPTLLRRLLEVLFVLAFVAAIAMLVCPVPPWIEGWQYCVFVELMLPVGLYLSITAKDRRLTYSWATMAATVVASALLTGSRAGCALIAVEVAIVPATRLMRGAWRPIAFTLVLVGVFASGVGLRQLAARFASETGIRNRSEMVTFAVTMTRDRPVTGFGLGSFGKLYPARVLMDDGAGRNHVHNDWAEWAATGGVPLLAMYVALFGLTLPLMLRNVWAIGVAAMCLHALVDFPFEIPGLLVLNAILLGAATAAQGDGESNTSAAVRNVLA